MKAKTIGRALLALLTAAALILRDNILTGFAAYHEALSPVAARAVSIFQLLPEAFTSEAVITLGFFSLGILAVLTPALLGAARSWLIVGLLFLALVVAWWYDAHASSGGTDSLWAAWPLLATKFTYGLGALAGAFAGEWLIFMMLGRKRGAKRKKSSAKAPAKKADPKKAHSAH